jgi:hypothetical protein
MMKFIGQLMLFCWIFVPVSAFSEVPSISSILSRPDPHQFVDSLSDDNRRRVVQELAEELQTGNRTKVAKLLCAIAPWSTGSVESDQRLQEASWKLMAKLDVHSEDFRWLDCAAANRAIIGYRDTSLSPLYDLRQSFCAGARISDDTIAYLNEVEDGIIAFNRSISDGLAKAVVEVGDDATARQSYYPTRNLFRLAVVRSARAVEIAKTDWAAAQSEFGTLASELREAEASLDMASIRGGWNYPNDLLFNASLYAWVSGVDEHLNFERLIVWPPVLEDPSSMGAIPPDVRQQLEREAPGHVEMIFIERLFPGASVPGEKECDGWRRRSYDVHRISSVVKSCAERLGRPKDLKGLRELDACILAYDADDWRVEFHTGLMPGLDAAEAQISRCVADVLNRPEISRLSSSEVEHLTLALEDRKIEPIDERLARIVTENVITTPQRVVLEEIFDNFACRGLRRPLMARPKMY